MGDDASTDEATCRDLEQMQALSQVRVLRQTNNLGRTLLCNALLQTTSQATHWLIIDADARVVSEDFVTTYWQARQRADVLVGGILTPEKCNPGCELRHRYERQAERIRSLNHRQAQPERYFSTFNVWLNQSALQTHSGKRISFDLRCREYGYEDTLLGIVLYQSGKKILHLNNPLLHMGINRNEVFLSNTEAALRNLYRLRKDLCEWSPILRLHRVLFRCRMAGVVAQLFVLFRPALRQNLLSSAPSLALFAVYKLGYYCWWVRTCLKNQK